VQRWFQGHLPRAAVTSRRATQYFAIITCERAIRARSARGTWTRRGLLALWRPDTSQTITG
jgi:hypothetical protein